MAGPTLHFWKTVCTFSLREVLCSAGEALFCLSHQPERSTWWVPRRERSQQLPPPPQLWNTLPHVTRPAYCSSLINSFFGNWQKWSCSGGPSCDLLWVFILLSWGVGGGIMIISAVILLNFSVIDSFLLCLYIFRFYSILLCFTLCKPSWGRQWLWEGGQSINQTKRFNNCPEVCLVEGRVKLGRWTKTYSTDLSMITPGGGGGAS